MILLESSALIESFRKKGRADIRARVQAALLSNSAAMCDPVLLELFAGAKGEKELALLRDYELHLPVLPCDNEAWALARSLAQNFRRQGKSFSNLDILIFAIARRHSAGIIAMDRAFQQMHRLAACPVR